MSVLSGNRNFEGRIHSEVKMNYLASPPLVVAYALAGRMDIDLTNEPLGEGSDGEPVYLRDIWPTQREIHDTIERGGPVRDVHAQLRRRVRGRRALELARGARRATSTTGAESTYVKRPPYFDGHAAPSRAPVEPITGARVLALLGDSVTTDHISPAGAIRPDSPAGRYLIEHGVEPRDFNSYGSRRGNHEVMMRGTFANVRLRNQLAPGTEGSWTVHLPSGEQMSIFDAAMRYMEEGVPLVVLAGKEYGSGLLARLGRQGAAAARRARRDRRELRAHPPLQPGRHGHPAAAVRRRRERRVARASPASETFDVADVADGRAHDDGDRAARTTATPVAFEATVRIDTPQEWLYYRHGGILQYVLRQLLRARTAR